MVLSQRHQHGKLLAFCFRFSSPLSGGRRYGLLTWRYGFLLLMWMPSILATPRCLLFSVSGYDMNSTARRHPWSAPSPAASVPSSGAAR